MTDDWNWLMYLGGFGMLWVAVYGGYDYEAERRRRRPP